MLNCSTCKKLLPESCFSRNRRSERGYQFNCKICLKVIQQKKRDLVSKDEAKAIMDELEKSGRVFCCSKCSKEMPPSSFYFKRDRGSVYVNTTACRECTREKARLRDFGITKSQFDEMLLKQDNKCLICGIEHEEYMKGSQNNKVFSVDHCHKTGRIRGLLCCSCNRGLGYFKDSVRSLENAIKYLDYDMV